MTRVALLALVLVLAGCGHAGKNDDQPSGPAVVELQQVMTTLGYYSGPIDGIYGDATTAGVMAMQTDLGVTADGIYGPETNAALHGKGHGIVVEIQNSLAKYGYYTGPIDGAYGSQTTEAVKKLQTDLGVTVDGKVGPETAAAFNDAVTNGTLTTATVTTTTTTEATTTTATTTTTS